MTNLMMPIHISSIDIQGSDIVCRDSETIRVRAGDNGAKLSIRLSDGRQKDGTDWNGAKYLVMDLCSFGKRIPLLSFGAYTNYMQDRRWPELNIGFSILPEVPVRIVVPLSDLSPSRLHIPRTPGRLLMFVYGKAVSIQDIDEFALRIPAFPEPIEISVSNMYLSDSVPEMLPVEKKLVDEMGQWQGKDWPEKMKSTDALTAYLMKILREAEQTDLTPQNDRSVYGDWMKKRLTKTGFFHTEIDDKRWWLVDPEGYAFISAGIDVIGGDRECYIKDMEQTLSWLPDPADDTWRDCWGSREGREKNSCFDFAAANLIRAYGQDWLQSWAATVRMRMHQWGLNTIGNWTSPDVARELKMPYVTQIHRFPTTEKKIFRDFPDVFSREYEENAEGIGNELSGLNEDPLLIGYFMLNEPAWSFTETVILAEEMLASTEKLESREAFIRWIQDRYQNISVLNENWSTEFNDFEELNQPLTRFSGTNDRVKEDLIAFSELMIARYVEIPAKVCRKACPNHLNLGIRWPNMHNLSRLAGSEYLDVVTLNRYAVTPRPDIEKYMSRLDMPLLIGEYHFTALDQGMASFGHIETPNQTERGKAYQYYTEAAISMPVCVGTHYFTWNDQGAIGRPDGECFPHGLVDVCQQPYQAFVDGIVKTTGHLYEVASGAEAPTEEKGKIELALFA